MYQFDFHHVVVHKITVRDANMCLARVPDTQIISCQPVSHTKSYSHYYMSHLYFIRHSRVSMQSISASSVCI